MTSILEWTLVRFGEHQANTYLEILIAQCNAVAKGLAHTQSCRDLVGSELKTDLRFTRAGQHFILFVDTLTRVEVVDFVHQSRDMAKWVSELGARQKG